MERLPEQAEAAAAARALMEARIMPGPAEPPGRETAEALEITPAAAAAAAVAAGQALLERMLT